MAKRCAITGLTRDKEYDLTKQTKGSRILHLSANPNGEAEILKITLKPRPRLRNLIIEYDFSQLAIKGKGSMGNILTKYAIHRIEVKEINGSTLGGQKIWFDTEVQRLNMEARGQYLGEFQSVDRIMVFYDSGIFCTYKPDLATHFDDGIRKMEKYDASKVYTVVYYDSDQKYFYIKRFMADINGKEQYFLPEDTNCKPILITDENYPRLNILFGGKNQNKEPEEIDAESFISIKGYKAKGKRLSNYEIKKVEELEPLKIKEEQLKPDKNLADDQEKPIVAQMSLDL
jgi:topoisomerase-4 subunit A